MRKNNFNPIIVGKKARKLDIRNGITRNITATRIVLK